MSIILVLFNNFRNSLTNILGSVGIYWRNFRTRLEYANVRRLIMTYLVLIFFYLRRRKKLEPYSNWLEVNSWQEPRQQLLGKALLEVQAPHQLSLIMPVFNPPPRYLHCALESLQQQAYPHWELCLADDGSTDPEIYRLIEAWQRREPRLQVTHCPQNGGVSRATNAAAALARYDHLLFLDHDDELPPDALAEVALCLARHPQTDVIYSDNDKIDGAGRRFDPHFKPDWSPELLLSYMYLAHLFGVRRELYQAVGGMRAGFEGSQDYDLALRITERTSNVRHIPKILYHWRVLPGSTALSGHEKPASFEAGRRAVQEALDRRGLPAQAQHPRWAYEGGCGIFTHKFPDTGPSVAILIPTKNRRRLLQTCLNSLARTSYRNYRIYVIDNDSDDPKTLDYLQSLPHPVWRLSCPGGIFNFAYLNNQAAEKTSEDYLLFLNNDTEVINPSWLSQMVGYLGIPGVGAVGARLLYPDGRVQHAGVLHGMHQGRPGHAFKLLKGSAWGYQAYAKVARNYSAVTGACMLTHRNLFRKLGGFDEQNFAVAFNDVDYCYRLLDSGHRIVYCPSAEVVHHESVTRGITLDPAEEAAYAGKYRHRYDPYYNPNLSLESGQFSLSARTSTPANCRPIRVLMCTHNLNLEGAPFVLLELARGLRDRGIIEPLIHSPQDGPLRQDFEAAGIPVWISPAPPPYPHDLKGYDEIIDGLARQIAAKGIDLIFSTTLLTFYAIAAADRLQLPCLWNLFESDPENLLIILPQIVRRQLIKCFEVPYQVICCSLATKFVYRSCNRRDNFLTVYNVPDFQNFDQLLQPWSREKARRELGVQPDEVLVLLLGTICERKGQMDLLKAVRGLDEPSLSRAKFILVGDRPNRYSQKLHARHASLEEKRRERLTIIPETKDLGLYFQAADIFLCTSRVEGFPRVILYAMYCRLPIITTPAFGVVEMVRDNYSTFYYSPRDYRHLARLLESLIKDQARRRQLADSAAFGLAALPDFNDMLNSYADLFREGFLSGKSRAVRP